MEVYKRIESSCLSTLRYMLVACMGITLHVMADTSVGTPVGSLSVNESGAAVYTIPFDISPSGTGLDPKIGLSYNSQQAGYGNAGYGISITGLSCITRTGKDIYHDGMMQKVRYKQETTISSTASVFISRAALQVQMARHILWKAILI